MVSWDGTEVRARIREMAARDPERARFGSDTHRYELRPALPGAEIGAFEEEHGIRLPPDYRAFVAEVGDGPAGPAHGLLPLATPRPEAADDWAVDGEWEEDRRPGRLATRFPLTGPRPGAIGVLAAEELTPGTLTLAEEGCGVYVRLVVTGPRAGEVWWLDPDWGGFVPAYSDFRTWYTNWLRAPA
ncbi:SMI1/KNR4 family protein [Streptomyces sp. TX20-6-3]|uniref:SMI1/KNR4 family protein n=1 Tax=Streptomyces sp. TX20-6-3 TaxID=3028705 RepID=UPI0029A1FB07|nr:SMI1/KNR4 family protein [Streptomyces sp. TX20-6-3]MDX2558562.1 SMI1/KNR4 family protein [Streptomyces sp. TX20-6-3]